MSAVTSVSQLNSHAARCQGRKVRLIRPRAQEINLPKGRPGDVQEVKFAVGALPQEEN